MARPRRKRAFSQTSRERRPLKSSGWPFDAISVRPRLEVLILGWTTYALANVPPLVCQHTVPAISIVSEPPVLTEGTLGWIQVRLQPDAGDTITGGEAGGEPIHLVRQDGHYRSLVGVPVEVGDSFRVTLFLRGNDRKDTVVTALPVRQGGYPNEVLAVAPAFVKPDSAAAARIQSEIAKSRQVSRQSQERPRLWKGPFRLPRTSRITSPFGAARVFNGEVQSRHLGTDFAGAIGAPVRSAGQGVVALVADFYLAGRAIYIDHGAGLVTAYFHLSRVDVRQGQRVIAGQRIGAVGRSGRVTGPHLHWVARYGAISVDPMSLLQLVKEPVPEPAPTKKEPPDSTRSLP